MKKIYILPYTFKTYYTHNKRGSGIETSMLSQMKALQDLGYDVRLYAPLGNLQDHLNGIDHYADTLPEGMNAKEYEKASRVKIQQKMFECITKFNPDVILSNYEFNSIYERLINLNIPIVFNSETMPGFWGDLTHANLLNKFLTMGNSLCCISDYHKMKTIKYYSSKRKGWNFDGISPDYVLFPQYCEQETAVPHSLTPAIPAGVVRHVSAATKEKKTFFIHEALDGSDVPTEVFTTINFLGGKADDPYIVDNLKKYNDWPRKTNLDVPHTEIMDRIKDSVCMFVGLASYDTFTITSLEALSRGVPLIVSNSNGKHPAQEMIEPEFSKYVYLYKNKTDLLEKVKEFTLMTVDERQALANSAYRVMSKDIFSSKIVDMLNKTIKKYNMTERNIGLF